MSSLLSYSMRDIQSLANFIPCSFYLKLALKHKFDSRPLRPSGHRELREHLHFAYGASVHYGDIVLCPLLEIEYDIILVSFRLFAITTHRERQSFEVLAVQRRIVS